MDPVKNLEEIAEKMGGQEPKRALREEDGYRAIRVRKDVYEELTQWREMWADTALSDTLRRILALARRELKNVVERERRIREKIDCDPENPC